MTKVPMDRRKVVGNHSPPWCVITGSELSFFCSLSEVTITDKTSVLPFLKRLGDLQSLITFLPDMSIYGILPEINKSHLI